MPSPLAIEPLEILVDLLSDTPNPEVFLKQEWWRVVRKTAVRHGLAPLIASIARAHLRGEEREWCDRVLIRSCVRYYNGLEALDQITSVFEKALIDVLVLKGCLLALRYYDPPSLRKPSNDIDLAVRGEDLERACAVLRSIGYGMDLPLEEAKLRSHHVGLSHPILPPIELHFRLSHGAFGIAVEEFFERSVMTMTPGGSKARVLCPADEFFHLVLHRAYGRYATLFHLYEIRRISRLVPPSVVDEALGRAAQYHFLGAFALTEIAFQLRWKESLLGSRPQRKTWLGSWIDRDLYREFELLSNPGRDLTLGVRLRRRWLDLKLTDRPTDAFRFLLIMCRIAWFQLRNSGWRTVRPIQGKHFV
jgi:hypothetical protein